jgi:glycosyltransferase involved in cell wall biosynthesis
MSKAMRLGRGVAVALRREPSASAKDAVAAEQRPRICFVAPHAWPVLRGDRRIPVVGGAEVQQTILARLFAANGYRVSMVCLDFGQANGAMIDGVAVVTAYRQDAGMPVLRFVHPRLTAMWRALREADADIYYCRAAGMLVGVVQAFCRRHGRRSIYAGASDMDFVPGEGGQIRFARDRWLYRRGVARVDALVAQNEQQRTTCRLNYGREAVVIPSCYTPPAAWRTDAVAKDCILWVGMMRPGKRPQLLLELAKRLPQRRFVMIGGPDRGDSALYERIRAAAAAIPNVELTGFLPLAEVEPWFDRAQMLVNTSDYEGMPNTFLQAWARGIPTVATVDVGAPVNRLFRTAEEGARAIDGLFASRAEWDSASQRCRDYFERNHSAAEALKRYAGLFDRLMA